jgi:TPR repeat protein
MTWFKAAASKGDGCAMSCIGVICARDRHDYKAAMDWFRRSADTGYVIATRNIGEMYYYATGVPRDYKEALANLQKSANAGDAQAMNDIGNAYFEGNGVRPDFHQAASWYAKAADHGDPCGMYNLARCYKFGKGIAQDQPLYAKWLRQSADAGFDVAKAELDPTQFGKGFEDLVDSKELRFVVAVAIVGLVIGTSDTPIWKTRESQTPEQESAYLARRLVEQRRLEEYKKSVGINGF